VHELSVVAGLFETILDLAAKNKAHKVTTVKLQVGPLSGVVPELLESAFEAYKAGTIAAEAVLEIDRRPVKLRCRACAAESEARDYAFVCAACGANDLDIVQGLELILERVDLETDDSDGSAGT
jgi:hydrogenase nickel incorporation protein HypA/HybF